MHKYEWKWAEHLRVYIILLDLISTYFQLFKSILLINRKMNRNVRQ
jgi:hypothetical protein